ncbi:hypothetical protein CVT26_013282 [Gymnopilus dilepis]|uniref:F-box domain-containing protein n=1 Tax=Gymnopilus dilepis TaxID=231916 RepID=A0A409VUR1_9AGAR|nr:hypothetical protein CVT26_013282 [Gymnopilus dilepis]
MATDDEMGGEVGSNIEWSSSDADGEGGDTEEGVVIDGNDVVVLFVQANWYNDAQLSGIGQEADRGYKVIVNDRFQYGQADGTGKGRFIVYHDKERKPYQHRFVHTTLLSSAGDAVGVLAKAIGGPGANAVDLASRITGRLFVFPELTKFYPTTCRRKRPTHTQIWPEFHTELFHQSMHWAWASVRSINFKRCKSNVHPFFSSLLRHNLLSMSWRLSDPSLYESHVVCDVSHRMHCVACIKLAEEESRLHEAKAALERQLEKCRSARTMVNRAHDRLINRLPRELFSLIFEHCFPPVKLERSSSTIFPHDFDRQVAARLLLGSVCTDWRRNAWLTPRLWSQLSVSLRNIHDDQWHLEFVRDWLRRSGGLPLSLSITCPYLFEDDCGRFRGLMNELNNVSDRWYVLEVKGVHCEYLPFFKAATARISILRTLSIHGIRDTEFDDQLCVFQGGLRPDKVILHGLSVKNVDINWETVTSLCLCGRTTLQCIEILSQAPNLQELALDLGGVPWGAMPSLSTKAIEHRQIRDLRIKQYDYESLNIALGDSVFPGLLNLTVTGCLILEPLSSFLCRSCRQLQFFSMNAPVDSIDQLLTLLELTPSITRLELQPMTHLRCLPDVLFQKLAVTAIPHTSPDGSSNIPFLPNLRHLTYNAEHLYVPWNQHQFINWGAIPPVFGALSELTNPRRRPLQTLEIYFKRGDDDRQTFYVEEQHMSSFTRILDAGLDLKLVYLEDYSDVLTKAKSRLSST